MNKIISEAVPPFYYVCKCGSFCDIDHDPLKKENWETPQNAEHRNIWKNFTHKKFHDCPLCAEIARILAEL